ncbi:Cof-type HAD-IIB family hydrolase [Loigolactobacillus binensis]|uniref:Cof-type HAD-IIB family hydrolase n=1 Tax=Loigolactobacillus binensis TaxID=2559922 RepID=A0ABW3ECI0_9LACO|nr:Cof-type HAD-IIB family hydrolase [Loigolactobacillus binensis]
MISLVGTDLDGTLFNEQSQVSAANRQAIQKISTQGVQIAICSGRTLPTVDQLLRDTLRVPGYRVCLNGAVIYGPNNQCLQATPLAADLILAAFTIARRWRVRLCVCSLTHMLVYEPTGSYQSSLRNQPDAQRQPITDLADLQRALAQPNAQFYKFTINLLEDDAASIRQAAQAIRQLPLHFVRSGRFFYEATALGVDKSAGLAVVAHHTHLRMADFMCFGDYENDLEMIRDVGYGVAMANALPSVKKVAWRETVDHDQDGVALILKQVVAQHLAI